MVLNVGGPTSATSLDNCERTAVYKKRTAEKGNKPKGVMVETWKYDNEDCVFVFGNEVSADAQRREKHSCTDGTSRSACRFG